MLEQLTSSKLTHPLRHFWSLPNDSSSSEVRIVVPASTRAFSHRHCFLAWTEGAPAHQFAMDLLRKVMPLLLQHGVTLLRCRLDWEQKKIN